MINPTPDVNCQYGAPMGRFTGPTPSTGNGDKWTLQHCPLDSGGYDSGGAYWGHGQRLYYCANEAGEESFFRASNRGVAKAYVRAEFDPMARFYC
jgi:hypothetical protein